MMNSLWVGSVKDPEKEPVTTSDASNSNAALFHRRIEFHLAKKPFNGFNDGGNSGNGFKLVTLNPYNSNASLKSEPHKAWSGSGKPPSESSSENHSGLDPELSFTITFRRIVRFFICFLNKVYIFPFLFSFLSSNVFFCCLIELCFFSGNFCMSRKH